MNEEELKAKIVKDVNRLVADFSAAGAITDNTNPFSRVSFNPDFLNTQLTQPIMQDLELKKVLLEMDEAIENKDTLKKVVQLAGKGLKLAVKYAV